MAVAADARRGDYTSVSEIGDAENISKSYVSRILRLALLAPDIVDAILAGRTDQAASAGEAGAAAAGKLGGAAAEDLPRVRRLIVPSTAELVGSATPHSSLG